MKDWRTQIEDILSGDPGGAGHFFAFWRPRIFRWAASYARFWWRPDAEEIAQEVIIKLTRQNCRALAEWRGMDDDEANSEADLAGYLLRICESKVRELRRARGRDCRAPLDRDERRAAPDSDALAALEGETLSEALEEAFASLSSFEQHVLTRRFIDGQSNKSISARMGLVPHIAADLAHWAEMKLLAGLADLMRPGTGRARETCNRPQRAASQGWAYVAMMHLTDDQLLTYLDGGEDDPFVAWMLGLDPKARRRLVFLRRVRQALVARKWSKHNRSFGPGKWKVRIE